MLKPMRFALIALAALVAWGCAPDPDTTGPTPGPAPDPETSCTLTPGTLPTPPATFDQASADVFSWETFGAIAGQWDDWYTTADMICAGENQRFIPAACKSLSSEYPNTRVLQQVGKVDDSFIEADVNGLSGLPVIDQNGNFLRYEIYPYYPSTYDWIIQNGLNKAVTADVDFPCSGSAGAPSMTVKLAWMDVGACGDPAPANAYAEDLLIYDSAGSSSTGSSTCACRQMALVGVHIVQKLENQSAWVWSTFENQNNAPDCLAASANMPASKPVNGGTGKPSPGPNTACPTSTTGSYFLYGDCPACTTSCNTGPAKTSADTCGTGGDDWCANVARNPSDASAAGTVSKLCRQVSADEYYGVSSWDDTPGNAACKPTSGPWSNYQLISTQWVSPDTTACGNVSAAFQAAGSGGAGTINGVTTTVEPTVTAPSPEQKSFMANTSMESYDRSNCLGCHAKSVTSGGYSTDFVYFLNLEVPESPLCGD